MGANPQNVDVYTFPEWTDVPLKSGFDKIRSTANCIVQFLKVLKDHWDEIISSDWVSLVEDAVFSNLGD